MSRLFKLKEIQGKQKKTTQSQTKLAETHELGARRLVILYVESAKYEGNRTEKLSLSFDYVNIPHSLISAL